MENIILIKSIDIFAILDNVTTTEGISLVQVNTWLLYILGIFVTVIIALFVCMNNRFDGVNTRFDGVTKQISTVEVAIAEIKAIMTMTKAVELGTTQDAVLKAASIEAKEKIQNKPE